jgi:7,8-dihydropterin-6-yl-methyl-4-(beta-D-ribofuranosyl)aminobenzene 5'-phosphate synthase
MNAIRAIKCLPVIGAWVFLNACGPVSPTVFGESSALVSTPRPDPEALHMTEESSVLEITIVYDNNPYDRRLTTAWGFAAWIEYRGSALLFDTGGDGRVLLQNMQVLGLDPLRLESVVLSHAHGDHTGGLDALLETGARPQVYLPPSFAGSYKRSIRQKTGLVEVTPGQLISEGIFTTGEMGRSIAEQSLVIRVSQGLVIITGCAHPGILEIVENARESFDEPVYLVLGGFHLGNKSENEIKAILAGFRRLGVKRVAPCHCTGERALTMFAAEYEDEFIQAGVGRFLQVGLQEP